MVYLCRMKNLFVVLGSIALALGVTGIFVPLLPTTPFLLLSAWLYCKGSPKLYGWLMGHPALGTYIRNYRDKRAVTLRTKVISLALLWGTILFCIFWVVNPLWLKLMLGVILFGVSWHLVSFRTIRRRDNMTLHKVSRESAMSRLNVLAEQAHSELGTAVSSELNAVAAGQNEDMSTVYFLLRAAGRDVGYIIIRHGDDTLAIDEMYLIPDFRGKGFGCDALVFLDYYCSYRGFKSLSLELDSSNVRASSFYRKQGFRIAESVSGDTVGGNIFMARLLGAASTTAA